MQSHLEHFLVRNSDIDIGVYYLDCEKQSRGLLPKHSDWHRILMYEGCGHGKQERESAARRKAPERHADAAAPTGLLFPRISHVSNAWKKQSLSQALE